MKGTKGRKSRAIIIGQRVQKRRKSEKWRERGEKRRRRERIRKRMK